MSLLLSSIKNPSVGGGKSSHLSLLQVCPPGLFGCRTKILLSCLPMVSSWSLAEGSKNTHGEWMACFSDPVPSDVGVKAHVQPLLFCSTVFLLVRLSLTPRQGGEELCKWFTLTLKATADLQQPPQGFGGYSFCVNRDCFQGTHFSMCTHKTI